MLVELLCFELCRGKDLLRILMWKSRLLGSKLSRLGQGFRGLLRLMLRLLIALLFCFAFLEIKI